MMPQRKGPEPISDLIDFYNRWPSLRPAMTSLSTAPGLSDEEQETLRWLIMLADRVGPADLQALR